MISTTTLIIISLISGLIWFIAGHIRGKTVELHRWYTAILMLPNSSARQEVIDSYLRVTGRKEL